MDVARVPELLAREAQGPILHPTSKMLECLQLTKKNVRGLQERSSSNPILAYLGLKVGEGSALLCMLNRSAANCAAKDLTFAHIRINREAF